MSKSLCVSACVCSSDYVCADTHTCSGVHRNTVGQMGHDVLSPDGLTCCPGFDELLSFFNPSPSIAHMLGNCQYRL